MNLEGWMSMGGIAPYVWGAIVICVIVLAAEVLALRARTRAALQAWAAASGAPAVPGTGDGSPSRRAAPLRGGAA